MNQTQIFTKSELKMFRKWSYILILTSLIGMLASFVMFFVSSTMESSLMRDFTFIFILVLSTGFFFAGQLLEQIGIGRQESRFFESDRKSAIRSAVYGIIASVAGLIILLIAMITH